MQFIDKTLSLGAKNSTVAAFKELVDYSTADTAKRITNDLAKLLNTDSHLVNTFTSPTRVEYIAELDRDLYDKALALPESSSVALKRISSTSKYQYGIFKGGNVYKSFDGTLDTSLSGAASQEGWVTFDNSSSKYCLFTNDTSTIIIAISDFEPTPIVEDFMPLYEKLKYRNTDEFFNDTMATYSLAASFRDSVSSFLIEKRYALWLIYMNTYRTVGEFQLLIHDLMESSKTLPVDAGSMSFINKILNNNYSHYFNGVSGKYISNTSYTNSDKLNKYNNEKGYYIRAANLDSNKKANHNSESFYGFYPKQISSTSNTKVADSAYSEVQAIIYDIPNNSSDIYNSSERKSNNVLFCYQQPERVSYTSAAQYDSISPRGSQVPFQFYQCANAMTLSFDLKFHIDEVRTFKNKDGGEYTLQDIEEIADGFTRPWAQGNSIKPKLCHVILPGVSKIGYITQAQISYSGDMSGNTASLFRNNNDTANGLESGGNVTDYYYTGLDISFELLIVQDVKLNRAKNEISIDSSEYSHRGKMNDKNLSRTSNDTSASSNNLEQYRDSSAKTLTLDQDYILDGYINATPATITPNQQEINNAFSKVDQSIDPISNSSKFVNTVSNSAKIASLTVSLAEAISNMNIAAKNLLLG